MDHASNSEVQESRKDVDIDALMADIRARVKADLEENGPAVPQYISTKVTPKDVAVNPILYSDELNYLNANWHNWIAAEDISSHRRLIGPLIVGFKKLMSKLFFASFKTYFEREREFQTHLVRFLNGMVRYVDDKDSEAFWRLIAKVDSDVLGVNERIDRVYDESTSTLRAAEKALVERVARLQAESEVLKQSQDMHAENLVALDSVVRGLERTMAMLGSPSPSGEEPIEEPTSEGALPSVPEGIDYLLLENRYRGSEEEIKARLSDYIPLFYDAPGTVLEFGCGRGEFLELLSEHQIDSFGIDLNEAMVQRCKQKGLPAAELDCLVYLEQLADDSVGGVFAAQLIEHLTREQLSKLLELSARKVRPGGRIVLETINPQSMVALSWNFFRDPTHIWPLHPETVQFMMEMKGIKTEDILLRSPFPSEAALRKLEISGHLPERWKHTLRQINDNLTILNDRLFGYQDYAVVGIIEQ